MDKNKLRLVTDKPEKPTRTYAGEPIKCAKCNNRNLMELKQPTYKDGKVIKGSHSSWMCPFCQKIIWP